jgi:hypothetical protein
MEARGLEEEYWRVETGGLWAEGDLCVSDEVC